LLMIISSISFSQTINGRMIEFEPNVNPFDSTLFVTLQIKLNENENGVLGQASNLKFDYGTETLQFVEGTYLNFNGDDGYQTSTITCPCGSNTIENIETHLVTGPGREVTDMYIDFIVFEFKIIDFSQLAWVCPRDSANSFYFHSPYTTEKEPTGDCDWIIGEWICYEAYVPVELTSFTATSKLGNVILNWATATELNNQGFEIERKLDNSVWERISFIEGYGTTTEPNEYSYIDNVSGITATSLTYRLKQIDFDGSYEYSDEVLVDNAVPVDYALEQNYPNPFNPSTNIRYTVPQSSYIVIKVFDILGNEIETLVREEKQIGMYEVEYDATALPSGSYFYRLQAVPIGRQAGTFIETKKMVLLR